MLPVDRNIHRPLHLYIKDAIYFVTSRTEGKRDFFNTEKKQIVLYKCLKEAVYKYNIFLYAWVILKNHYHLLFKNTKNKQIFKFINFINGKSSFILNSQENLRGRQIWYQYWDYCPRDERDFYTHFNYIHHNPVKHSICLNQDAVEGYKFCSYKKWFDKMGEEWILSCFSEYPIIDFTVEVN